MLIMCGYCHKGIGASVYGPNGERSPLLAYSFSNWMSRVWFLVWSQGIVNLFGTGIPREYCW